MQGLTSCPCCGLIQQRVECPPRKAARCARCGSKLHQHGDPVDPTPALALAAAACALYPPAILLPLLRVEKLGHVTENNVLEGVGTLFDHGQILIGTVILLFSLVLPLVKLLLIVGLSVAEGSLTHHHRASTYRFMEFIGRWGLLDVLVVATIVVFVKMGDLVEFHIGPGAVAFLGFVVCSMLATSLFDHHGLWEAEHAMTDPTAPNPAPGPGSNPGSAPASGTGPTAAAAHNLTGIPRAVVGPRFNRKLLWWFAPVIAVGAAVYAFGSFWATRGRTIQLHFAEGHGLKAGDALRFRSIDGGVIRQVKLGHNLQSVDVTIELVPEGDRLAVRGSRFWIVRPQVEFTGVTGLDTVASAKYVAVLPGPEEGPAESDFLGLDKPPPEDLAYPGGLEILLQAEQVGGLRPGAPVYFRQMRIGGVLTTRLDPSGAAVDVLCYIRPEFRSFVRQEAKFWLEDGVSFGVEGGLTTGMRVLGHMGSIDTLVRAGIGMGVPANPGRTVSTGHRFRLHLEPQREWLETRVDVGDGLAPVSVVVPPQRVRLEWRSSGGVLALGRTVDKSLEGSGLIVEGGLLAPADLLIPPAGAQPSTAFVQVAERRMPAGQTDPWGVGVVRLQVPDLVPAWPARLVRKPPQPEDCVVIDREGGQAPLRASLLEREGDWWLIPYAWDRTRHGLPVLAASDGKLIGMVVHRPDVGQVGCVVVPFK